MKPLQSLDDDDNGTLTSSSNIARYFSKTEYVCLVR